MHKFSVGQRVKVKADPRPMSEVCHPAIRYVGCVGEITNATLGRPANEGADVRCYEIVHRLKDHLPRHLLVAEDDLELAADDDQGGKPRIKHRISMIIEEIDSDNVISTFEITTDPAIDPASGVESLDVRDAHPIISCSAAQLQAFTLHLGEIEEKVRQRAAADGE